PILAHPPDTDSDITLQEWLAEMVSTNKGIKLDFKRLFSAAALLNCGKNHDQALNVQVGAFSLFQLHEIGPCWAFYSASTGASSCTDVKVTESAPCLSAGYAWHMVQEMARLCRPLPPPVTFAVRAALVPGSIPQLQWLLQQSPRYTLTVWTGKEDMYSVEDLLFIRENFDRSRVYYDIFEPQNSEFKKAIGM
ncbi:F151B protein, partial [Gymnorhina tibicen]|nr:F151B protein [Gymnorhina tibicen]